MCGITGKIYFDRKHNVEIDELKGMTDSIIHRGPDDEGHYIDGNVGLGFRRLSIIDLKLGHQPLSNIDKSLWITFNGEIYNYKGLKFDLIKKGYRFRTSTDTEVIVNLYAEYGSECVKYLRGMFAFVIWDNRKKQLFGVRDRFGIKPFYYYIDNEKFVWGSEIKAINASYGIKRRLDICALDSYFAYGYITGNRSIYNSIKKLEPAHYFILKPFESSYINIQRYWNINFEPDYSKTEQGWEELIREILLESINMRLMSDVPLGAFLSGGIDSSAVVANMSKSSTQPVKTFSIGFKEEKYNELQYAKLVAKKYKTEHHEMIVEPESIELLPKLVKAYDEPFADSSAIPTYYVSKFAREYVTVVLSGDGGDELFAGYDAFAKMMKIYSNPLNNNLFNWGSKIVNKIIPDYLFGKGITYYYSKRKKDIAAYFCMWKNYEREKIYNKDFLNRRELFRAENNHINLINNSNGDRLSKFQELWMRNYLVDDILTKVDKASMMNSLETRVPLLDHKFAELSFRIPSTLKLKKQNKKYIFKKAIEKDLPAKILSHKKHGFAIPLRVWFKDDLKDYIFSALSNKKSKTFDYLDYDKVQTIINNHQKGLRNYSDKIWSLLFFDEWIRQNI